MGQQHDDAGVKVSENGTKAETALARVPRLPSAPTEIEQLKELVDLDLRGKIDNDGLLALQSIPQYWLSALYAVLRDVQDQVAYRDGLIERELGSPDRDPAYGERRARYQAWRRKVQHFGRCVQQRINQVRLLIPEGDLRLMLSDGARLDPGDSAAIRTWQARVQRALAI